MCRHSYPLQSPGALTVTGRRNGGVKKGTKTGREKKKCKQEHETIQELNAVGRASAALLSVTGLNKREGQRPFQPECTKQPEDVAVQECLLRGAYLPLRSLSLAAYALTI